MQQRKEKVEFKSVRSNNNKKQCKSNSVCQDNNKKRPHQYKYIKKDKAKYNLDKKLGEALSVKLDSEVVSFCCHVAKQF